MLSRQAAVRAPGMRLPPTNVDSDTQVPLPQAGQVSGPSWKHSSQSAQKARRPRGTWMVGRAVNALRRMLCPLSVQRAVDCLGEIGGRAQVNAKPKLSHPLISL
jgi:hypothetical protein